MATWTDRMRQLCDGCVLTDDGGSFPVHRILMSMMSPFFHTVFTGRHSADSKVCRVPGVKGETMETIIEYTLDKKARINANNINDLLIASDFLLIHDLLKKCCDYVKVNLSIPSCASLYDTFSRLDHLGLAELYYRFILVNFEKVLQSSKDSLLDLRVEDLEKLLSSDDINIYDEWTIWKALLLWVGKDPDNRMSSVPRLLRCLRLKEDEFMEISNDSIIQQTITCSYEQLAVNKNRRPLLPKTAYVIFQSEKNKCTCKMTYDGEMDYWRAISDVPFHPNAVLHGPKLTAYLLHDNSFWIYDLNRRHARSVTTLRTQRFDFGLAILKNRLYVIGGTIYLPRFTKLRTVDCFNPTLLRWTWAQSTNYPCRGQAVVLKEKIYAFGERFDEESEQYIISGECYDPTSDTWTLIPPLYRFEEPFSVLVFRSRIYIFSRNKMRIEIRKYNPRITKWSKIKNLKDVFMTPKAIVLKNTIVIYEGDTEVRHPKSFMWNRAKHKWEPSIGMLSELRRYHIFKINRRHGLKKLGFRSDHEWERTLI